MLIDYSGFICFIANFVPKLIPYLTFAFVFVIYSILFTFLGVYMLLLLARVQGQRTSRTP